jgi:hypothetical protein
MSYNASTQILQEAKAQPGRANTGVSLIICHAPAENHRAAQKPSRMHMLCVYVRVCPEQSTTRLADMVASQDSLQLPRTSRTQLVSRKQVRAHNTQQSEHRYILAYIK